jgi:hypothetical protein
VTKVLAATRDHSESQIAEDALRSSLRTDDLESATADLKALMWRVAAGGDLGEHEAMDLAVEESHAVRHPNDAA